MNSTAPQEAINAENLLFRYSAKSPLVLQIPSLRVERGEHLLLMGPSGCGKTTLLGLLAGILAPSEGHLHILGQDMSALGSRGRDALRANRIGYIFQMLNLVPYLSVKDNIALACHLSDARMRRVGKANLEEKVSAMATALGLDTLLTRDANRLSVGQQQRVAVARALLGDPDIIIADEPTSALDADNRQTFLKLLFEQCRRLGATLVFVSHDASLIPHFPRTLSLLDINKAQSNPREGA